jgi:RNA polymerase subunit RPABC4/transcription elongation factor Spt4
MGVQNCPDCGGMVSDQATSCPHCGRPKTARPQLIEQTSKKWKAVQVIGVPLALIGIVVAMLTARGHTGLEATTGFWIGLVIACIGAGVALAGAIGAWWHHG